MGKQVIYPHLLAFMIFLLFLVISSTIQCLRWVILCCSIQGYITTIDGSSCSIVI